MEAARCSFRSRTTARRAAKRASRSLPQSAAWIAVTAILLASTADRGRADDALEIVRGVELQPLASQAKRVAQALDQILGAPLSEKQQAELDKALKLKDADEAVVAIQKVLDPLCLVGVDINPESRVKVARGPAAARLQMQGWRTFLVKVHNEGGVTAALRCTSPNAPELRFSSGRPDPKTPKIDTSDHWLGIDLMDKQPLNKNLSGLELE